MDKSVGLGLIVVFVNYSQQYYQPITQITSIYNMLQLAVTGARRLSDVHEQAEEVNPESGQKLTNLKSGVTLENIHLDTMMTKKFFTVFQLTLKKGK